MRNHETKGIDTTDVIIVGGGVIGLATARALNERGVAGVTVIERSEPGCEASYAAGGMLAAQAEADIAGGLFELSVSSRELYPDWATSLLEETGIDIQLERTGTLYLAFTERDDEEAEQRLTWQTEAGLPVERLSSNEALELAPGISNSVRSALRFPLDVQVDNRLLISALVSSLLTRHVRLLTRTHATSLCIENDRVTGIKTDSATIRAPIVIIANGAWASFLINSDSRLPPLSIEPVRGQMLCFRSAARVRHVLYSPRGYIIPRTSGQILVGSTSERVGFSKDVTGAGIHTIMTNALEIAPDVISSATLVDSWAGLRPRAEDGLPVIGACAEIEGLYFATGHYRNGILLAPLTGSLIAEQITTGVAPAMAHSFSPDRFHTAAVS
jgi:glycine oxidase